VITHTLQGVDQCIDADKLVRGFKHWPAGPPAESAP
jgi:hypothetical protein